MAAVSDLDKRERVMVLIKNEINQKREVFLYLKSSNPLL